LFSFSLSLLSRTWAIHKRDVTLETHPCSTTGTLAKGLVLLARAIRAIASRARASRVVALVDLGVCITKLDRDVSLELVLEAHSLREKKKEGERAMRICTTGKRWRKRFRQRTKKNPREKPNHQEKKHDLELPLTCTPEIAFTTVDFP
jgi:hypothetical protein